MLRFLSSRRINLIIIVSGVFSETFGRETLSYRNIRPLLPGGILNLTAKFCKFFNEQGRSPEPRHSRKRPVSYLPWPSRKSNMMISRNWRNLAIWLGSGNSVFEIEIQCNMKTVQWCVYWFSLYMKLLCMYWDSPAKRKYSYDPGYDLSHVPDYNFILLFMWYWL